MSSSKPGSNLPQQGPGSGSGNGGKDLLSGHESSKVSSTMLSPGSRNTTDVDAQSAKLIQILTDMTKDVVCDSVSCMFLHIRGEEAPDFTAVFCFASTTMVLSLATLIMKGLCLLKHGPSGCSLMDFGMALNEPWLAGHLQPWG
ncbi:hypothetical protein J7T55_006404 [Diaporthe amygdali]|uniref:uncharacterized protein n=1 Tax=Phomopsis amygdali TaxID=1214568 RepID=UPI0022FF34FA|nr:uncharacterized protein J7T55_006404 [Diaporthe amygdali]KAJ0125060.1 hypothetical protein J7T55_006404 [Diaporthe amygdali]